MHKKVKSFNRLEKNSTQGFGLLDFFHHVGKFIYRLCIIGLLRLECLWDIFFVSNEMLAGVYTFTVDYLCEGIVILIGYPRLGIK